MRMTIVALGLLLAACERNAPVSEPNASGVEPLPANEVGSPPITNAPDSAVPDNATETANARACQTQDGEAIAANRLRATGTEPFWSAAIDGRCITYSTPENQAGTRIWAKFTGSGDSGRWSGFLGKDRFVLMTRADAKCSDGMSDKIYPIAVTLTIGSEERRGCAAPE